MQTVRPHDFRGTPVPAKRRKKKVGATATSTSTVQTAPPVASVVRPDDGAKKTVKKKKKKRLASGSGLLGGEACVASSSRSDAPVAVAAVESKVDALDDIFASLSGKKAARDAKKRVREEQEALDEAAAAAEAKERQRLLRHLPRDYVFGETYDPNATFDPMLAPIHRVGRHGQKCPGSRQPRVPAAPEANPFE